MPVYTLFYGDLLCFIDRILVIFYGFVERLTINRGISINNRHRFSRVCYNLTRVECKEVNVHETCTSSCVII